MQRTLNYLANCVKNYVKNYMNMTRIACAMLALTCLASRSANARIQAKANAASNTKNETQTETSTGTKTRSVIDEAGRRVAVPVNVHRIVTLAPNLAEIIYALGAEDKLVGVSEYSDIPPAAKAKPKIGMPVNPSLEAIVGDRPDVVLATTSINFVKTADALARLGIPVYTTNPHTVEGTLHSIADIGGVIGAAQQAQSVVASLQARLDALKVKLADSTPVRSLFVVWEDPLITIGDNTFIADALRWAGADSAIHTTQNWPQIGMEEVVKLNPDYLVYADNQMGEAAKDSSPTPDFPSAIAHHLSELRRNPAWRELPAVRAGHVAVVGDEIEVPAPGLIDTIEQLARELHPDVFAQAGKWTAPAISTEALPCAR